jgi:hypothetical protein
MKRSSILLLVAFFAATSVFSGQSASTSDGQQTPASKTAKATKKKAEVHLKPFSAFALGGGVSLMGVNMQAATNLNRYLNLRGTGNVFNYSVNNISVNGSTGNSGFSTNGLNLDGKVNMATAGVSLDYFPFPKHGLRLSPGMLFYNQNQISANAVEAAGNSFTLNGNTYYSATANAATGAAPLNVAANLGLNTHQQALTLTTGWGNMIPRNGGHWSFPFEVGAAFTGTPSLNVNLTGWACIDQAQTECSDVTSTTNPIGLAVQSNLNAQVTKWKSDLDPLKVYPIFSFGASYDFHIK